MQFIETPEGYTYAVFLDGNRNGCVCRDIQSGIDRRNRRAESGCSISSPEWTSAHSRALAGRRVANAGDRDSTWIATWCAALSIAESSGMRRSPLR